MSDNLSVGAEAGAIPLLPVTATRDAGLTEESRGKWNSKTVKKLISGIGLFAGGVIAGAAAGAATIYFGLNPDCNRSVAKLTTTEDSSSVTPQFTTQVTDSSSVTPQFTTPVTDSTSADKLYHLNNITEQQELNVAIQLDSATKQLFNSSLMHNIKKTYSDFSELISALVKDIYKVNGLLIAERFLLRDKSQQISGLQDKQPDPMIQFNSLGMKFDRDKIIGAVISLNIITSEDFDDNKLLELIQLSKSNPKSFRNALDRTLQVCKRLEYNFKIDIVSKSSVIFTGLSTLLTHLQQSQQIMLEDILLSCYVNVEDKASITSAILKAKVLENVKAYRDAMAMSCYYETLLTSIQTAYKFTEQLLKAAYSAKFTLLSKDFFEENTNIPGGIIKASMLGAEELEQKVTELTALLSEWYQNHLLPYTQTILDYAFNAPGQESIVKSDYGAYSNLIKEFISLRANNSQLTTPPTQVEVEDFMKSPKILQEFSPATNAGSSEYQKMIDFQNKQLQPRFKKLVGATKKSDALRANYYGDIIKHRLQAFADKQFLDEQRLTELFGSDSQSKQLDAPIEKAAEHLTKEDHGPHFKLKR